MIPLVYVFSVSSNPNMHSVPFIFFSKMVNRLFRLNLQSESIESKADCAGHRQDARMSHLHTRFINFFFSSFYYCTPCPRRFCLTTS